jgi:hypothetical protein
MSKPKKIPEFHYLLPPEECERIYTVLGGEPGLDPCGHVDQFLRAKTVLYGMDDADDGLTAQWRDYGTVFLNAPHGEREPDWDTIEKDNPGWQRPDWRWHAFSKWITKASVEAQNGATVIAFMPASTDRKWFHHYVTTSTSIAFLEQRVKCYVPDRTNEDSEPKRGPQPMNPHMVVLWTADKATADRFFETYKARGMVVEPNPVDE